MKTHIVPVDANSSDFKKCLNIRKIVFVQGQNVAEELENDGLDGESRHYLISVNDVAAGTARVRYVAAKAKIERVAILSEYQGRGLGRQLMQFIIEDIQAANIAKIIALSSQVYAIPFYESLGFAVCSDEYMDANIPHKDMQMPL